MRKLIALPAVLLLAVMLLTGCGCMGCGGDDYADDGVVDGSAGTNSTDSVVGGDESRTADESMNGAGGLIDRAENAMDEMLGGNGTSGSAQSGGITD